MPLTTLPNYYFYNIFAHEDFYERFLGVLTQQKDAFEKAENWTENVFTPPKGQ